MRTTYQSTVVFTKRPNFCQLAEKRFGYKFIVNAISSFVMGAAMVMAMMPGISRGQSTSTIQTASYTPTSLAPGAPAGSYSLSEIENINLFSGNLNITFPLKRIGGRGEAGYTIALPIENKWRIQDDYYPSGTWGGGPPPQSAFAHHYHPIQGWWTKGAGYGPGIMRSRRNSTYQGGCPPVSGSINGGEVQTLMTFSGPGGTEMSFFDRRTGGSPAVYPPNDNCLNTPDAALRGNVWITGDGSNVTFVTDGNITEQPGNSSQIPVVGFPSGDMYFPNGTRYRIDGGNVTYIIDRNGNKTTFTYSAQYDGVVTSITDSLGRTINPSGGISFPGVGGVTRTIQTGADNLGNLLRAGYTLKSKQDLYPELGADADSSILNYQVTSFVRLPDGRQYNLKYDSYGDIARIELPTGGAVEYDWSGTATTACGARIQRWVTERRTYPNGGTGTSYESRTTYERGLDTIDGNSVIKRTITQYGHTTGGDTVLAVSKHYFTGEEPTCTYGSDHLDYILPTGQYGRELQTESYAADGTSLLRRVKTDFEFRSISTTAGTKQVDYRPIRVTTTLADISPNLISKQEFAYDQNVDFTRQTDVYEYDFGSGQVGNFKRRQHTDFLTTNPNQNNTNYLDPGIYLRNLPVQNWVSSDINGASKVSLAQISYDDYTVNPLVARPNVIGQDTTNFGTSRVVRGNPTTVTKYSDVNNSSTGISASAQYDVLGNIIKTIDGKGNVSTLSYNDRFGIADGEAQSNTAPTQLNTLNTYAFATSATNPLGHTAYTQFDYFTGAMVNSQDINGVISKIIYNDMLDRPTQTTSAVGTVFEQQASVIYDDPNHRIQQTVDLNTLNDNLLKSESFYDGLGRTTETRKYEANGGYVASDSEYDGFGRVKRVTNPYRPSEVNASNPILWTESFYDSLGRTTKIKTPDNAELNTSYSGNVVTVTDQAGKVRRSVTNGLGQLVSIDEPTDTSGLGTINSPNQSTAYNYDALNNLTQVQQSGNNITQCGGTLMTCLQTRSFLYDSLSRLKSVTNPESGIVQYTYDNNNNLQTKRDARGIKSVYDYDNLNRVIKRCYRTIGTTAPLGMTTCTSNNEMPEPNTSDVTYTYDNLTNAKGKLTKVSSAVSTTEYTAFDILGRVLSHKQTTDGTAYTTAYVYNLSGAMTEETYPSTRVVRNVLNNNGDLSIVQSKKTQTTGYWNYADSFTYTAAGAISSMQLGNGKWESSVFNSRLQPTQINLGTTPGAADKLNLIFNYGTTNNNGNVQSQTINVPAVGQAPGFTAVQTYSYDSLNRLKSATENINGSQTASWKQTYLYDRYGNRNFDTAAGNTTTLGACSTAQCNPSIDVSKNRLTTGQGYTYDLAGNVTADAQGRTFAYDAENKQKSIVSGSTMLGTYFYDGDGKRVKKLVGTETTIFVYDASEKLVAEYATTLSSTPQVSYLASDHLGSPRINTDANGNVMARHDYMPFGEEITSMQTSQRNINLNYAGDTVIQKFTAYERDIESSLDFAEARYYNFNHGRFTSTDLLLQSGRIEDPQTWNRYAYVLNNPLNYIDPDGLYQCKQTADAQECKNFRDNLADARAKLADIEKKYGGKGSDEYIKAKKSVDSYGCESKSGNCVDADGKALKDEKGNLIKDTASNVIVSFDWTGKSPAHTSTDVTSGIINIQFGKGNDSNLGLIANEGIDSANMQSAIKTGKSVTQYESDRDGLFVQAVFGELRAAANNIPSVHFNLPNNGEAKYWDKGWETADHTTVRSNRNVAIDKVLTDIYKISPKDKRPLVTFPKGYKPRG